MDRETGEFHVYAKKEVVEEVERPATQISLEKAKMMNSKYDLGDIINIEITTKDFGRIAAQRARNESFRQLMRAKEMRFTITSIQKRRISSQVSFRDMLETTSMSVWMTRQKQS